MSGLADELLADLDGLSDNGSADYEENQDAPAPTTSSTPNGLKRKAEGDIDMSEDEGEAEEEEGVSGEGLVLDGGVNPAEELDAEDVQQMDLGAIEDVGSIAKLEGSKKMSDILKVTPSSLTALVLFLMLHYVGNWEIPSKSKLSRCNVASCPLEPRVHSHRASK